MERTVLKGLAATGKVLIAAPAYAVQQLDTSDLPIVRRRAPAGHRRAGLAFARTELFFGTAKREGAVTPIEPVYARQKHPFMSPPATIQQNGRLFTFLQDTLRSSALDGPGIYDRRKVTAMLDAIPSMDPAGRGRADALLMWMTSLCLLSERLGL